MTETIKALTTTWLKKDYRIQSELLAGHLKVEVPEGKEYKVDDVEERDADTDMGGHFKIDLAHGAGSWYLFGEHWHLPWQVEIKTPPQTLPEWNEVDWTDWDAPVSKYFTVGEVTIRDKERIPTQTDIKKNVIAMAREMDKIREWWDAPLAVTSWYRPWPVNIRIGSRAPNHPGGNAVDFRPAKGSVQALEKRFRDEWYNTGKWKGGFGLGAKKGFIHLDLRHRRMWNY